MGKEKKTEFFGEMLQEIVILIHAANRIIFADHKAANLFGLENGELIGKNLLKFVSASSRLKIENSQKRQLEKNEPGFSDTITLITKEGKEIEVVFVEQALPSWMERVCFVKILPLQNCLPEFLTDDERILLQGMLHDLSNCAMIVGNHDVPGFQRPVQPITEKILLLIKQMQELLAGNQSAMEIIELNRFILDQEDSLRQLICGKAGLFFTFSKDAILIRANPAQISQILDNLVLNAAQAISNQGEIEITTGIEMSAGRVNAFFTVKDNGSGMTREVQEKMFDLFFTTKEEKKDQTSRGIGLSSVKRIVEKAGGEIRVVSQIGQGTEMTILWPVVDFWNNEDTNRLSSTQEQPSLTTLKKIVQKI